MSATKLRIIGTLRYSEEGGLEYPWVNQFGRITSWLEAIPDSLQWRGVAKPPEKPKPATVPYSRGGKAMTRTIAANEAADEEWKRACEAVNEANHRAIHANPKYKQAVNEFIDLQNREPQELQNRLWAYRKNVISLTSTEHETLSEQALLVKHYVLRRARNYERVRREVEALENMEKLEGTPREPIPESVRLFVWQRDRGQCVKCGSRERLEFDHIIPLASGGSNTERNIQVLCESCNRSKGSNV